MTSPTIPPLPLSKISASSSSPASSSSSSTTRETSDPVTEIKNPLAARIRSFRLASGKGSIIFDWNERKGRPRAFLYTPRGTSSSKIPQKWLPPELLKIKSIQDFFAYLENVEVSFTDKRKLMITPRGSLTSGSAPVASSSTYGRDKTINRCNYSFWLTRLQRLKSACSQGLISAENLQKFQLFLLETGQFNASYSLGELKKLNYPKSPFALMFDHAYLRATDTWAMQMLRMCYRQTFQGLHPLWLNSNQLQQELPKYARVVKWSQISEFLATGQNRGQIVWIEADSGPKLRNGKPDLIKLYNQLKSTIKPICFFYDQFHGTHAIVFSSKIRIDDRSSNNYAVELINSLGCRVDSTQVIRTILELYPRLFIDPETTGKFWEIFKETDIVKKLPPDERLNVDDVLDAQGIAEENEFYREHSELQSFEPSMPPNFNLYAQFLLRSLREIGKNPDPAFRAICYPEIREHLQSFLNCYRANHFSAALHPVQMVAEILLLHLNLSPEKLSFSDIVQERYLRNYCCQGALITSYAMQAFTHALQIIPSSHRHNISVANQSYYELLENFERVESQGATIRQIRQIEDIQPDSDAIFLEIHLNNVMIRKQFAQDLVGLLQKIKEWQKQGPMKRTIVLDITLNTFDDPELKQFLSRARLLVDDGWLNIILIQSLTKFAQLGLDKRSGGCMAIINNPLYWQNLCENFHQLKALGAADLTTDRFFAFFADDPPRLNQYIGLINANVRVVYKETLRLMNELESSNHCRFQISMSSDAQSCYIAINMQNLTAEVESLQDSTYPAFSISTEEIERFSTDLLNHFFYPLCEFFHLPITARESIGFPLTSINAIKDSFRLTIGLEAEGPLHQYAQILSYMAFVLNRQQAVEIFFCLQEWEKTKNIKDRHYHRTEFFDEKVRQFKAMTPGMNETLELMCVRPLGRSGTLLFDNGSVSFLPDRRLSTPTPLLVRVSMGEPSGTPIELVDPIQRRMAASCFTAIATLGKTIQQNAKTLVDRSKQEFHITSYQVGLHWKCNDLYGPFQLHNSSETCHFRLHQRRIHLILGAAEYNEEHIFVKQGAILTPLIDMPLTAREFLIRQSSYRHDRSIPSFGVASGYDFQYLPNHPSLMISRIAEERFLIEHDFQTSLFTGVDLYHRYFEETLTCFEIDYWAEKDPVLSRFLRLMTAIFVKTTAAHRGQSGIGFRPYDLSFSHFVFNIQLGLGISIFEEAIPIILAKKNALQELLSKGITDSTQYRFNHDLAPHTASRYRWPAPPTEMTQDFVTNKALIDQALQLLLDEQGHSGSSSSSST